MASVQDITHLAGDSATIRIKIEDETTGDPIDLQNATARWWMGRSSRAKDGSVYVKKSTADPLEITLAEELDGFWYVTIFIGPEDTEDLSTGDFYHECEVQDAGGGVATVLYGTFTLQPTIIPASG